ncbi:restriction endonuclease [Pseudoxanthomonas beigongshangi]|uniref:restriction endonuclease n=1 Tax=Pseudoxanthomonas beigongshangi TaxID=2782537 RepID=UPI00193BF18D|nr:restriction endonuclease [Pseudoxanthomonas beigongshangi]
MGRGKRNLIDVLAGLPWPVGLMVGALGYLTLAHGVPLWFARQGGPLAQAFTGASHPFSLLGWLFFGVCAIGALASFFNARRTRRLLDTRTDLESLAALGWRDFERLVGEAFRRRGYSVEETGLGGADGGIDLILRRDGRRILVQCKQWRRERVPVNVVREMYGLMAHHRADEVRIAALGGFTPDAERFAEGKRIGLIDGSTLLAMIELGRVVSSGAIDARNRVEPKLAATTEKLIDIPSCPRCGETMVHRVNRRNGNGFWGCSTFPTCKGIRN